MVRLVSRTCPLSASTLSFSTECTMFSSTGTILSSSDHPRETVVDVGIHYFFPRPSFGYNRLLCEWGRRQTPSRHWLLWSLWSPVDSGFTSSLDDPRRFLPLVQFPTSAVALAFSWTILHWPVTVEIWKTARLPRDTDLLHLLHRGYRPRGGNFSRPCASACPA